MNYLENEQELKELLKKDLVIIDFYATWCGPCQMLSPVLEELAKENKELTIVKVDVDKHEHLAREHGIMSIPVLEIYKKSELKQRVVGYQTKENIEAVLK